MKKYLPVVLMSLTLLMFLPLDDALGYSFKVCPSSGSCYPSVSAVSVSLEENYVTIAATATDISGVCSINVKINDSAGNLKATQIMSAEDTGQTGSNTYNAHVNISGLAPGTYAVDIFAQDCLGNSHTYSDPSWKFDKIVKSTNLNFTVVPASARQGDSVTFTAVLTSSYAVAVPNKTITFSIITGSAPPEPGLPIVYYTDQIATAVTNSSGTASITYRVPSNMAGTRTFLASFAGDSEYGASQAIQPFFVLTPTKINFTYFNPLTVAQGGRVSFTVALKDLSSDAPIPNKMISFYDGTNRIATAVTDSSGAASAQYIISLYAALGPHYFTASFAGDSVYDFSKTATQLLNVRAAQLATQINLSINPQTAVRGDTVSLTALLTDSGGTAVPNKTITFLMSDSWAQTTQTATAVTDSTGTASLPYAVALDSGPSVAIKASFAGDSDFFSSASSTETLNVILPSSTMMLFNLSPLSAPPGGTVYLNATLVAFPSIIAGLQVDFYDGTTYITSAPTNYSGEASAVYILPSDAVLGTHTLRAVFTGTRRFFPSEAESDLNVKFITQLSLSVIPGTVVQRGNVLLTAVLTNSNGSGIPNETITFYDQPPATSNSSNDTNNFNIPVAIATAVTDSTGTASVNFPFYTAGVHTLIASFAGDSTYAPFDSQPQALTVQILSVMYFNVTPPAPGIYTVYLSAQLVEPWPLDPSQNKISGETIKFYDGTIQIASATTDNNGVAAIMANIFPTPGTHYLNAIFSGDTFRNIAPSSAMQVVYIIFPSQMTLTINPITASRGGSVQLSAYLTSLPSYLRIVFPLPHETIRFYDTTLTSGGSGDINSTPVLIAAVVTDSIGRALYTYTIPANEVIGQHVITADFGGDLGTGYGSSSAFATLNITTTSVTLLGP